MSPVKPLTEMTPEELRVEINLLRERRLSPCVTSLIFIVFIELLPSGQLPFINPIFWIVLFLYHGLNVYEFRFYFLNFQFVKNEREA